ncbi:MAG: sigma 54-interacting transcriptional regulator [Thermoanaerobaculales bacterium]|nr:sigma 54-interacting transcriptional regulator [Thermoanaerobaculales bacterium]
MAWRILIRLDDRNFRVALGLGELTVGSRSDCDISIPHPTVSRQHAVLRVTENKVVLEDAGSRNGVRIGGKKIETIDLQPGRTVLIGGVPILLEEIPESDLEPALVFPEHPGKTGEDGDPTNHSTCSAGPSEAFATRYLPALLAQLTRGTDAGAMTRAVGAALFDSLPCLELTVHRGEGVEFTAKHEGATAAHSESCVNTSTGEADLCATFPTSHLATAFTPMIEIGTQLISLAESRDQGPTPIPTTGYPPLPAPATIVRRVQKIYADAGRVARGDVGVLILGESGTGKEILAHYVHQASPRSQKPFLGLNCASLPGDLLESELFGIEKGVATGVDARPGRFELADEGTLFLDEIGDMTPDTQAKILRVLQSGEVYRLGSAQPHRVNVRIIAATNQDIRSMLNDGSFRTDLYHRVATWVVELPPLRHRRGDIPNLAAHFLAHAATKNGVKVGGISRAALDALLAVRWSGNIRQLENEMTRAALFLEQGELLDTSRLSEEILSASKINSGQSLASVLERVERDEISIALNTAEQNVDAAAERLGLSRATLYRRIKALGISTG